MTLGAADPINYCELPKAQQAKAPAEIPAAPAPNIPETPACPAGYDLTGDRCARRTLVPPGLVQVQPPTKATTPAAPRPQITTKVPSVPSQTTACAKGQVASNGHCCPVGKHWANGRCVTQTDTCSNGTRLIGGKCQCPQRTAWSERQDRCVAQTKTAETKSCAANQIRVRGQCRCPDGTAWTGSRCEPRGQARFDRPGQKGKSQSQAPGRQIQFRPLPHLNKGPVRR